MPLPAGLGMHGQHEQLGGLLPVGVGRRTDRGEPDDLLLDYLEKGRRVTEGTTVVTSGFTSAREGVESNFPRGIPIGRVVRADLDEVDLYQRVHIKPFADLRRLEFVQVLTRKGRAQETAEVVAP